MNNSKSGTRARASLLTIGVVLALGLFVLAGAGMYLRRIMRAPAESVPDTPAPAESVPEAQFPAESVPDVVAEDRLELSDDVIRLLDGLAANIPEADLFSAPGLVADRRDRSVTLFAAATGLPSGTTAEFILVGPDSVHDYEAIARTFALPSDIARAVEFIGVPRGEPAFASPMAFWPRGERVMGFFIPLEEPEHGELPLESLVRDNRREEPLPARGLIYAGSRWSADGSCAADSSSPGSVVSTYNEPTTLFDLPHMAPQSDVYDTFVANPDVTFEPGAVLRIRLTPEPRPEGLPRVAPYRMDVAPEVAGADTVRVSLRAPDREPAELSAPTMAAALRYLRRRIEEDAIDPYLSVYFDDELRLAQARDAARALQAVEGPRGLRVDAPPEQQPYYKAFNPNEAWRKREERMAQPWELHVRRTNEDLVLVEIREHWVDDQIRPNLEIVEHLLRDGQTLSERLNALGGGLPVILVFAEAHAPLADFMPALRSVRETHPTVHVFVGTP